MLHCQSPLFAGNVFMHSYKMIVIRHDATANMLWEKFAFENLKANSETKVLAKTPCKTLKQMAKNKNALFLSVGRF